MDDSGYNMAENDDVACTSEDSSQVKEHSYEQREALPGEPRCTICSRYGEYICDQTDDDICSLQCKSILLSRLAARENNIKERKPIVNITVTDECFYVRNEGLTNDQVASLRTKMGISVKGESVPDPVVSFFSCNIPQKLENNIETAGFVMPTPVQMQTIPAALRNRNLLVSAETGSGKTASFLVPIISHCSQVRSDQSTQDKRPLAMVLTPTRELCVQVEEQAKVLGKGLPFKTALVVGGDAMPSQIYRIGNGVELIIGTPGRLLDLLKKHDIDLSELSILVLDEVDCLLQKGFIEQVMEIVTALQQPQIWMFSATVSNEVERMASSIASNLIHISCGKANEPNKSVKQVAIWVESNQKKKKLFEILSSPRHFNPPAVVFVGSRLGSEMLSEAVTVTTGLKAIAIHGEKTMKERREGMKMFLTGEVPVVVSTGVLGRGMDLLKVRQVIIFDMPSSIEEYVHQVGRASSRKGEEGTAIIFINGEDKNHFGDLVRVLKSAGAAVPPQLARYKPPSSASHGTCKKKRRVGL
ncbi:DEAD-box ATP-dependent RNA helicase 41 [Rhynchospora pubera]|uniref:DEAD-box ATP-dependent RNA helicase 41 n=1 Tax=Rhynchospora pubera TaxID=906938 RepID=A0AAV8H189_9POAL|nr:DEAD-box ATP-dependent RNA helicase 41 [Rhynchospora pubera]